MAGKKELSKGLAEVPPDLMEELQNGAENAAPFAVVYKLKGSEGKSVPPSAITAKLVPEILERAEKLTRSKPKKQNIFQNLGAFVVLGDAELHKELLKQPEVGSAVLNKSRATTSGGTTARSTRKKGA